MPKLKHTGILLVLLVFPFLFKLYFGELMEVYPSITLPAFPSILNAEKGELVSRYQDLYVASNGEWILLDQAKMFYPLKNTFYSNIIGKEFGLKNRQLYGERKLYTVLQHLKFVKNRDLSQDDKHEVFDWLKTRLNWMGIEGNKIKIVLVEKTSSLDAKLLKTEIVNEEIIELF